MSCSRSRDHHDDDCCRRKEKVKFDAKIEFDHDDFCDAVRRCEKKCDDKFDDDRKHRNKCFWW